MSEPFIGEIQAFAYTSGIPDGWLLCDGTTYSVQLYSSLYAVIGNTFGGKLDVDFSVPNLMLRIAIGTGQASNGRGKKTHVIGEKVGSNKAYANWPSHNHLLLKHPPKTSGVAQKVATPTTRTELAQISPTTGSPNYKSFIEEDQIDTNLSSETVETYGRISVVEHENRQPILYLRYAIAHRGVWPAY